MSDLHDARVEEIAEVMADMNGEPRVGRYERTLATVALKNADALVTVEMIAEVLDSAYPYTVKHGGLRPAAESVLALLRGGEER
ncbi:MAG: hypothetical protein WAO76_16170 [Georgfuchsia sp.]